MSFAVASPLAQYFYDAGTYLIDIPDGCTSFQPSGVGAGGRGGVNAFAAGGGGAGGGSGLYTVDPADWTSATGVQLLVVVGTTTAGDGEDTTLNVTLVSGVVAATAGGGKAGAGAVPGVAGTASGWNVDNVAGMDGDDYTISDAPGQGGSSGIQPIIVLGNTQIDPALGIGGRGSTSAPGGSGQAGKFEVIFNF